MNFSSVQCPIPCQNLFFKRVKRKKHFKHKKKLNYSQIILMIKISFSKKTIVFILFVYILAEAFASSSQFSTTNPNLEPIILSISPRHPPVEEIQYRFVFPTRPTNGELIKTEHPPTVYQSQDPRPQIRAQHTNYWHRAANKQAFVAEITGVP